MAMMFHEEIVSRTEHVLDGFKCDRCGTVYKMQDSRSEVMTALSWKYDNGKHVALCRKCAACVLCAFIRQST